MFHPQVKQQLERQADVLRAVRYLTNHGKHREAQAIWNLAFKPQRVLLPGEAVTF